MKVWASIVASFMAILKSLVDVFVQTKWENIGKMKERQTNEEANRDLAADIARASPDSVSDDEAFGRGTDDTVPRPDKS